MGFLNNSPMVGAQPQLLPVSSLYRIDLSKQIIPIKKITNSICLLKNILLTLQALYMNSNSTIITTTTTTGIIPGGR